MKIWTVLGKHAPRGFRRICNLVKTKSPANADSELGNVCSNVMRKLIAGGASETPADAGKVKVDYLGRYDVREVQLWVIVKAMDQVMTM